MRLKSGKIVGMLATACVLLGGSVKAGTIISDGDFSNPNVHGGVSYTPNSDPNRTPWLYSAHTNSVTGAGVAASGVYNPVSPGGQAGFVQGSGSSISQHFTVPSTGVYEVTFLDEARHNSLSNPFVVELNGKKIGATQTPATFTYFTPVTILLNKLTAGTVYNLSFVGLGASGKPKSDATSFIDNVNVIASVPSPKAFAGGFMLFLLCGAGKLWNRRQLPVA